MSKISYGTWLTIYSEAIAELLSRAGYEWITIDLEHTSISISEAEKLIRIIDLCGVKPIVRVSSNNSAEIKKILDFGARGVIIPMVNNVDDVKNAIKACFYPPLGLRGMGLNRAQGYGDKVTKERYIKDEAKKIELYLNIESKEAVKNIDSIFASDITGYFLGPYDLSASIGSPGKFDTLEFIDLEKKIIKAAEKYNIKKGIHVVEPSRKQLHEKQSLGYDMIAFSVDFRMLDSVSRIPFENE